MWRKFYFFTESLKLKYFESILEHASLLLPISTGDAVQLKKKFESVILLPAFHSNSEVTSIAGRGDFVLYHGNLGVAENNQAALFLVTKVFSDLKLRLIIAGSYPSSLLVNEIRKNEFVELRMNPSEAEMRELISMAQILALPAFQNTGTKLKLLNALYQGRFVVASAEMVDGSNLDQLTYRANTAIEMKEIIQQLMPIEFPQTEIEKRRAVLSAQYGNRQNAAMLLNLLNAGSP
jgi:hypothetical protein